MDAQTIIKEMKVLPEINPEFEIQRRIEFIKKQLIASGLKNLVLGISGGIDSTTCGRLAQLAVAELNQEQQENHYAFYAVRLPHDIQADEDDAQTSLQFIQPDHSLAVNVKPGTDGIHNEVLGALEKHGLLNQTHYAIDFAKGNVKARTRMIVQFEIAGLVSGLVLGTDHSAENVTGFFTKFGDSACDLAPLFGLSKRQVKQVAQTLGAPQQLIEKTPTADLECHSPSKADELALGIEYDKLDDFLEGKAVDDETKAKIIKIYANTQHKRQAIPTIYS
ncbi:MAG: ammonia-dependent NAD(+) synthetase [gamma proteobacterium symbiont of Bathyaustriella thionipta]|nr:ammonia-dependent NAD(+) synthetase [gamma proteobacterium symbiont of Bathyaustriella thionipta]MCU7950245.1 ammonia-dependent NAD(+) synthetase [gamma proteobacterium symbiont of Bathyaustriella thionipta]MCU7953855.1 ammonia-dependent NAD(+) synthetase [gamma proteobacterium symbiont of Bathyaustriella thionipta]MCU7956331.1 ammonia-dependent NAD(+) synthetase [gamma proteobacterium symbiont of Bathyaustriella thionipta]MCU7966749.1 ammonia-dependent NAD(+) synthetase [gamma proteobacteri